MPGLTYEYLLHAGAFATLAELFPDEESSRALLEDIGISGTQFRPFGQLPTELYWRNVCRTIGHGRFADVDLDRLYTEAAHHYPANGSLKELVTPHKRVDELRVLCLSAGPIDLNRLRLRAEQRAITEATERSERPITIMLHPATRRTDLIRRILDAEPDILHFAGHGTPDGELLLEDDAGYTAPVDLRALATLLGTLPRLQSIVLTSCFSGGYAELLRTASDTVIGSPEPLMDACAVGFVGPFYQALGKGKEIGQAFAFAHAALDVLGCPPHVLRIEPGP